MRSLVGFSLVLLLLWLSGCGTRPSQSSTSTESRQTFDSTYVREIIRPVLITVPGDTVTKEIQLECDPVTNKPKPISKAAKGRQAGLDLVIDKTGKLKATAFCDEVRKQLEVVDRVLTRIQKDIQERSEQQVVYKTITEYRTHWYDIPCRWITIIALLVIAIKQILKRFKRTII